MKNFNTYITEALIKNHVQAPKINDDPSDYILVWATNNQFKVLKENYRDRMTDSNRIDNSCLFYFTFNEWREIKKKFNIDEYSVDIYTIPQTYKSIKEFVYDWSNSNIKLNDLTYQIN